MSLNKKLLHIFYILTVIATKTIADPSNTLLGFWPLDEGKGKIIYDKSPNKNNGSANATWAWNSNKEKAALELQASKNSYVTIPFKPEFNISEELTIQAWIYPFDKKESMIASKGRIHWACGYYLMQSGAEIEFGACTEKCLPKDTPKAFKVKSNANAIKINDWNHIACTYSVKSDKTILYINGKKVKEAKANGKISHHLYPSTPLRFGVDSYATNYYRFSGFLRNIKIHNEALAENAIKKEYTKSENIKELKIIPSRVAFQKKSTARLNISIVDKNTDEAKNGKVYVKTRDNIFLFPKENCLAKFGNSNNGFFFNDGSFKISAPPGNLEICASCGLEYEVKKIELSLKDAETKNITIKLKRFIDMPSLGWRSGDPHLHYIHYYEDYGNAEPSSLERACKICQAAGLNFAAFQCGLRDIKSKDKYNNKDFVLSLGHEYRNDAAGHFTWVNSRREKYPTETGNFDCLAQIEEIKNDGGILFYNDVSSLGPEINNASAHGYSREMPIAVAMGKMPIAEFFCGRSISFGPQVNDWYRYLNCGFKIAAAASTDGGVYGESAHNIAPGAIRTYVRANNFNIDSIIDGLRKGRTFVSNGPLIFFNINGKKIGDTICLPGAKPQEIKCQIKVLSIFGMESCELIMNGKIIKKFNAEEGKINVSFPIKVSNTCWFAVRACAHNRFPNAKHKLKAHTSPIYVQFGNKTIIPPKEDIQYFLRWLDKCKTFGEKWSKMKNDKTKTRLEKYLKLVDEAQQVYQELLTKPRTWEKDTEEPLLTLFHCSDPHASPKRPVHNKNLLKAIDYINKTKPDIVVFTGDLGESAKEEDLRLFESCMKKISCPVFCVPGNHDINNKKGIPPEVSPESISLYNKIFKTDYWHKKVKEKIHFIGINSVIINSALPREKEQWDWLIKELDSIPNDNIIILCSHYPLFIKDVQNGSYFLIDSPGRERLIKLIEKYNIKAFLSGHRHIPFAQKHGNCTYINAPAMSFSLTKDKNDTGINLIKIYPDNLNCDTLKINELKDN